MTADWVEGAAAVMVYVAAAAAILGTLVVVAVVAWRDLREVSGKRK